jgi:hypothetical protein
MNYKFLIPVFLFAVYGSVFRPHDQLQKPSPQVAAFKLRAPEVVWKTESLLTADFNRDGQSDYVLGGVKDDRFIVGILSGPLTSRSKSWFIEFSREQNSLCSLDAVIKLEALNEDVVGHAPGSGTEKVGIELQNGECDSFHIYWDPKTRKFTWWRR